MPEHVQIAIDGPAGAGKSTVAKMVAEQLGYTFVDTGAMYRCVAWQSLQDGVTLDDVEGMAAIAERIAIRFGPLEGGRQRVWVDETELTDAIRTPEVHAIVSPVSAIQPVREALTAQMRHYAEMGPVVMEGRDIQTVVLPQAQVKVFLNASVDERARRRHAELPDGSMTLSEVAANINDRDTRDSSRANAPLRAADDATVIDTDGLTIPDVVQKIVDLAAARCG